MDHALVVRVLERIANLRNDLQRLARGQATSLFELAQIRAIHELHEEEVEAGEGLGDGVWRLGRSAAELVNRDDVRMTQPRQGPGFAIEPLLEVRAVRALPRQNLQRHEAVERRLSRLVNRAHSARAEQAEEFELGKQPGDFLEGRLLESTAASGVARLRVRALRQQTGRA